GVVAQGEKSETTQMEVMASLRVSVPMHKHQAEKVRQLPTHQKTLVYHIDLDLALAVLLQMGTLLIVTGVRELHH
ncbi:hypothetical protein, partial [Serratia marcescens]